VENPSFNDLGQLAGGLPLYVGKGIGARAFAGHRWAGRVNRGERTNSPWIYKLAQMLRERADFAVFVLFEELSESAAYEREAAVINEIGRRNAGTGPLYNLTDGGEGLTSERAREMSNSPAFKAAMAAMHARPMYQAKNRQHLAKIHADSQQQERGRQWAEEQNAKRRDERACLVFVLAWGASSSDLAALIETAESKRREKGRADWEKRKERANASRREAHRTRTRKTKQEQERKTLEGRQARNAQDRARRRRKREIKLGLIES
jgi:hypothetical protein